MWTCTGGTLGDKLKYMQNLLLSNQKLQWTNLLLIILILVDHTWSKPTLTLFGYAVLSSSLMQRQSQINTPVTPQGIVYCIFSCSLQGTHFNTSIRRPWRSLWRWIIWIGAWRNAIVHTVNFICFRLIRWLWKTEQGVWKQEKKYNQY